MNVMGTIFGAPEPLALASFVGCAFFLVAGWNQVEKFFDRRKDRPPASEVRAEIVDKFVTKDQCENYHQALERRIAFLDTQRVEDAKDGSVSRSRIYDEMKAIQKTTMDELAHVRTEMGDMERRLNKADEDRTSDIHDRVNQILGEVREMRGEIKSLTS